MAAGDHLGGQFEVFHGEHMSSQAGFLQAGHYVHVGSRRAALARVHPDLWEEDEGHPPSVEIARGQSRIWQGRIKADATVAPPLTDEQANYMHVTAEARGRPGSPYDVYPYKNDYEDPGSTAYLVHPHALERMRPLGSGPSKIRKMIEQEGD